MNLFHVNATAANVALLAAQLAGKKPDQSGWLRDAGDAIHAGEVPLPTVTIILVGGALKDLVISQQGKHCQFSYELGDLMASFFFFNTPVKDVLRQVQKGRLAFKVKRVMSPVQGGSGEWYRPLASVLV
jgi:hypothetical protein